MKTRKKVLLSIFTLSMMLSSALAGGSALYANSEVETDKIVEETLPQEENVTEETPIEENTSQEENVIEEEKAEEEKKETLPQEEVAGENVTKEETKQESTPVMKAAPRVSDGTSLSDWDVVDNGDGSITISNYKGTSNDVIIPATIDGKKVKMGWSFIGDPIRAEQIKSITINAGAEVMDLNMLTVYTKNLETFSAVGVDFSNSMMAQNLTMMFSFCHNLKKIDFSDAKMGEIYFTAAEVFPSLEEAYFDGATLKFGPMSESSPKPIGLFQNAKNLKKVSFAGTNFEIEQFSFEFFKKMFYGCENLETVDMSNAQFFVNSAQANFRYMFYDCPSLTTFNTDGVKVHTDDNMAPDYKGFYKISVDNMFVNCTSLTEIDLSSLHSGIMLNYHDALPGEDVTNSHMFENCPALSKVNMSNLTFKGDNPDGYLMDIFDDKCIGIKEAIFQNCRFQTFGQLFDQYNSPETVDFSGSQFNGMHSNVTNLLSNKMTGLNGLEANGSALDRGGPSIKHANFSNCVFSDINMGNPNIDTLFRGLETLETVDLSGAIIGSALEDAMTYFPVLPGEMHQVEEGEASLFKDLPNLKSVDLSGSRIGYRIDTYSGEVLPLAPNSDLRNVFTNCKNLESVNLSNTKFYVNDPMGGKGPHFNGTPATGMFEDCPNLTTINFANAEFIRNTSIGAKVSLESMFEDLSGLKNIDISNWKFTVNGPVSYADEMSFSLNNMFAGCENLETVSFAGWEHLAGNPLNTTQADNIFTVDTMTEMFKDCKNLKTVDMSGIIEKLNSSKEGLLSTGKASIDLSRMFQNCENLESLKWPLVGGFHDVAKLDMENMFDGCIRIKYVDLTGFVDKNYQSEINLDSDLANTFKNLESVEVINLGDFNITESGVVDGSLDERFPLEDYPDTQSGAKPHGFVVVSSVLAKELDGKTTDYSDLRLMYGPYYDANGGMINGKDKETYFDTYVVAKVSDADASKYDIYNKFTPTREGYTFTGWYTDKACTTKYDGTDKTVFNLLGHEEAGKTLYAGWEAKTYTVKYDVNGGNAIPDKKVHFTDASLLPKDPTREGYVFKGWTYKGKEVTASMTYKSLVKNDTVESITLVANWEKAPVKPDPTPNPDPKPEVKPTPTPPTVQPETGTSETPPASTVTPEKEEDVYLIITEDIPLSELLKHGNGYDVVAKYITVQSEKYGVVDFKMVYSDVEKRVGKYDVKVTTKDGKELSGKISVVDDREMPVIPKTGADDDCFMHWIMLVLTGLFSLYGGISMVKAHRDIKDEEKAYEQSKEMSE